MGQTISTGNNFETRSADTTPESKRKLTTTQKISLGVAAVMTAGAVFGVNATLRPNEVRQAATSESDANLNNEEARLNAFIAEYGNRFNDPTSVYYSEVEYETSNLDGSTAHRKSLMISDDTIATYRMDTRPNTEKSPLVGFEKYKLPIDTKLDGDAAVKIFNEYISKEIELYLNAIAKNPSPEAQAVIDFEFQNYCSNLDNGALIDYDKYNQNLMNTLKAVVNKLGSNSAYYVKPGGLPENTTPDNTIIENNVIQGAPNSQYNTFHIHADVVIYANTTNKDGGSSQPTTLTGMQFFNFWDNQTSQLAIGQIGKTEPITPGQ